MVRDQAVTNTKDTIIKYLRGYLRNIENYSDVTSLDFTNAEIYDKQPNELRYFPSVLVTALNGNFITAGLGDYATELYDKNGICIGCRYSGFLELPITIETATRTTPERDILTDLIIQMLRVEARRDIEAEGFLIKDARYASESEIVYENDKVYIASINCTIWLQWYKDIDYVRVKKININSSPYHE